MKILIIPNMQKITALKVAGDVYNILKQNNAQVYSFSEYKDAFKGLDIEYINPEEDFSFIDIAFVIGGDGTIIQAANILLEAEIPILGINCGTLGFLATIEKNEIDRIEEVLKGKYIVDERMTLKTTIYHKDKSVSFAAVNDIVISKNAITGILDIDVDCGNIRTAHYRGDGIIVSTPSGSTAYAMSAGGPIMHPSVKAIAITPVCAHSLHARTMVLPENEKITIKTNAGLVHKSAYVIADGINAEELFEGDSVEICRHIKNIKFISLKDKNYYHALNRKLMEG